MRILKQIRTMSQVVQRSLYEPVSDVYSSQLRWPPVLPKHKVQW